MTERTPMTRERQAIIEAPKQHEVLPTEAQAEPLREHEEAPRHYDIAEAQQQVANELQEVDSQDALAELQEAEQPPAAAIASSSVNRELKNITLTRELKHIRRRLPAPDRTLSKIIHQPAIKAVSESASATLTRPSGLLGGGIFAFIGTSGYVYFTHRIGLPYNYLLFSIFFVAGFALGLMVEFLLWLTTHRQK